MERQDINIEDQEICPVCLENLTSQNQRKIRICGHKLCKNCYQKLIKSAQESQIKPKCPICRGPLIYRDWLESKLPGGFYELIMTGFKALLFYLMIILMVALFGYIMTKISEISQFASEKVDETMSMSIVE